MKKIKLLTALVLTLTLLYACSPDSPDTTSAEATYTQADTPGVSEAETNAPETELFINPLTGCETETDRTSTRPVAVVLKNDRNGAPQLGIGSADIVYEALVEGGITRLLAVYADYEGVSDIGPVIDSRSYFYDFALNHDAFVVQAGTTKAGGEAQKQSGIYVVDATAGSLEPTFRRDAELAEKRGYESSIVTKGSLLQSAASMKLIPRSLTEGFSHTLRFDTAGSIYKSDERVCVKVTIPYSASQSPYFVYSTVTNTYTRYQYDEQHIDAVTNQPLRFTNILILFTDYTIIDTESGEMSAQTTGEGSGYYISGGRYMPIIWSRSSQSAPTEYYTQSGARVTFLPGKTFISAASKRIESKVTIEG